MDFTSYYDDETQITVSVIADSLSAVTNQRATTMLWRVPRFILPQLNTHRKFSRNVASSRAKRFSTLLKDATYKPVLWLKNHKGMQADEVVSSMRETVANLVWESSKFSSIAHGWILDKIGVSKQYTNRIIEPYCFVNYLVTSTEWDNFLAQRLDSHAQFEIQVLAYRAKLALQSSVPVVLNQGEWHLPFIRLNENAMPLYDKVRFSAARCARTSYGDNILQIDFEKEFKLYKTLVHSRPPHLSPVEHQLVVEDVKQSGNIDGFVQLRKKIEELKYDEIDIRKWIESYDASVGVVSG